MTSKTKRKIKWTLVLGATLITLGLMSGALKVSFDPGPVKTFTSKQLEKASDAVK